MKEQLIQLETAKLAKEKGFDITCDKAYVNNKPILRRYPWPLTMQVSDFSLAPTQSLLQKWLRDVHNIHIEIQSPDTTQETWGSHIRNINKFGNRGDCGDSETYEQALEAGLLEALKLIKNEKV